MIDDRWRHDQRASPLVDEACPALPELEGIYLTLRAMPWAELAGRLPADVQCHYQRIRRETIEVGRRLIAEQIFDTHRNRSLHYGNRHGFLADFDVLACPTVGCAPGCVEGTLPLLVE